MNPTTLKRLRRLLEKYRRQSKGDIASNKLEQLAESLGRRRVSRGKHPTFESVLLPNSRPLTIPHHSKKLNRYVADDILMQLEEDIDRLEEQNEKGKQRESQKGQKK